MSTRRRWRSAVAAVAITATALAGLTTATLATATPAATAETGPITDPAPEEIQSTLGLVLQEYAQFPKTEPIPAPIDRRLMRHARINALGELPDGSGRTYVPDLNGPLYFVQDGGEPQVYLDVAARFAPEFFSGRGMGSGFGFAAFHPDFEDNGTFYTVHSERPGNAGPPSDPTTYPPQNPTFLHSVVTEWVADDPSADVFTGTSREVLRLGFAGQVHAIQQIDFNPTARPGDEDYGLLYLAVGDGGIGVGTGVPQDRATPAGKILRIDPAGTNGPGGTYGIPPSNPFVDTPGTLGEIYAIGMRDPHRFSWDQESRHDDARMLLGHIGEHAIEAVYDVQAGDNFGWGVREGKYVFDSTDRCNLYPLPENDAELGFTYPVVAYDHDPPPGWSCTADSGYAISGGFVYRGDDRDLRALKGKYLFTDLVEGRVFYAEESQMRRGRAEAQMYELALYDTDGTRKRMPDFTGDERADLRMGRDSAGDLYLIAKANGKIWKVVDTIKAPVPQDVTRSLQGSSVSFYDFEHPFQQNGSVEIDRGASRTYLNLINGGEDMRVADGAYPGSNNSIQLGQVNPLEAGNDDWKAGVFNAAGVPTLSRLAGVDGITVMGWVKMTGQNPSPNSTTADPDDLYNAVGLAGVLSGDSDGHGVRALLEIIEVDGELRLVALGRRIDGGASQTFAAHEDWRTLLPQDEWVHLAATFDYATGRMALYRNGERVPGFYTVAGDPWQVDGSGSSDTTPRGIKIGGSFPQDTQERNPCNCSMDTIQLLDKAATPREVAAQYRLMTR
ncbi:PQQ-dependent sugar dehydrogenase [Promicromonospora sp. Populi]|uniref:PQQ-dependent sugar dehydrogenase n=1 Tax=Promicromonospora sp. Populi TaxID=3239420 RepID=UPI0034E2BD6F